MFNRVTLIGRLSKNLELLSFKAKDGNQTALGKGTIAVSEGYGENAKTNFIPFTCFGTTALNTERYTGKGTLIGIEGRLQQEQWIDREGKNRSSISVIAERVIFLETKKATNYQQQPQYNQASNNNNLRPQDMPNYSYQPQDAYANYGNQNQQQPQTIRTPNGEEIKLPWD